ncbi:MAG: hypothetical protein IJ141_01090 [Lachnospiraceae bacterium]|nr:hypothetical protein [Lachnospiraceae bacterium]
MTLDEKIKMLNDYAIAWYSSSQADYIHEATFRAQGFGKFADRCKEEAEEELEEAIKCTERIVALGGQPVFGCVEQPIFCEIKDLLKDWDDGFREQKGVEELEKVAAALTDDSITRKLVESFVECESDHRAWVAKHLGIIEKIGYDNYLIAQLGD